MFKAKSAISDRGNFERHKRPNFHKINDFITTYLTLCGILPSPSILSSIEA